MNLADIPLFSMLRGRLGYLSERQKVIAQNVANADTARYTPEDLKPFSFDAKVAMARQGQAGAGPGGVPMMATTQAGHMSPKNERRGLGAAYKSVKTPDSETTLNGNSVVLEEEMIKMGDARMQYDAAISFYQKSMNLLRMAAKPPGRA
ncbi:flagellar basal body rod protein FlgB [Phenylobacterium sp.]|uniref:flagellar basal body rod protein FlgB n=1 Tax=Phenylobacterium sp. TaxID=1871053 RepID=UPI0025E6D374|nr:flagellar basal body rod protein FlgB [Phenylobacterium sp.]MBX3483274.1 flagellar basal body rod protein FlgB [Phenylobacterium sp.]MCW5759476.1 flagellar basal body rod protein FlgB [Phenylobacterium sp.]